MTINKTHEKRLIGAVLRILRNADMTLMTESKVRKLASEDTGYDLMQPAYRRVVSRVIKDFFTKGVDGSGSGSESGSAEEAIKPSNRSASLGKSKRQAHNSSSDSEEKDEVAPRKPAAKERKRRTSDEDESEEVDDEEDDDDDDYEDEDEDEEEDEKKPHARKRPSSRGRDRENSRGIVSGEEDEGSEEEKVAPIKKQGEQVFQKSADGNVIVCQLSAKRNVTVSEFKGQKLVSIRDYYEKDGKMLPTQKGISLSIDQWETFKECVPDIEAAIKRIKQ